MLTFTIDRPSPKDLNTGHAEMWHTVKKLYPKWPEDEEEGLKGFVIRQTLGSALFLYYFKMLLQEGEESQPKLIGFALVQAVDIFQLWV